MARAGLAAPDRAERRRRVMHLLGQSLHGFSLTADDWWVIATAVVGNIACALVGCFLVLRRLSLLGDAISHAILPGLAAAFLLTGTRNPGAMMLGALAAGALTAVMSAGLARTGKVSEDSSLGVVFTTLFALGVLMITWVAHDVDLDPGCVLYGLIEFASLDTVKVLGVEMPRALVWLGVVMMVNLTVVTVFFKELKIVAFDPYLATTMGINAAVVHYGLMTLVAGTTVAAFESVGSILVVTMLVAPAATAHLLTDRLSRMLVLASALGAAAAVIGYLLALHWNTSVAGMMSVVAGVQFALAALAGPRYGYAARAIRRVELAFSIAKEDVLGILYRLHERAADGSAGRMSLMTAREVVGATASPMLAKVAAWRLRRLGLVERQGEVMHLTAAGLTRAKSVVRSHRLWETYLTKKLGLPEDHVHDPSERVEHYISAEMQQRLGREVGGEKDPHGREIPPG